MLSAGQLHRGVDESFLLHATASRRAGVATSRDGTVLIAYYGSKACRALRSLYVIASTLSTLDSVFYGSFGKLLT